MNNFQYSRATDVADAVRQLAADPAAKFIAGGTNLLDLMKYEVVKPARLIDISHLPLKTVEQLPGGEDTPHVFAGTLAVSGHGVAEVTATGRNTQMGRIGASLAGIDSGQTPLQRQLGRLVRQFGWVAIALSALLVLGYGLLRGQWLQGLLSALAFAMAMLPEEIPMVMTVFIGLAAWRMARVKVLAREVKPPRMR